MAKECNNIRLSKSFTCILYSPNHILLNGNICYKLSLVSFIIQNNIIEFSLKKGRTLLSIVTSYICNTNAIHFFLLAIVHPFFLSLNDKEEDENAGCNNTIGSR